VVPHRIRRLRLRVKAPSGMHGSVLRARLRDLLEREILPALERSFDAVDPGGRVLHVPRLVIQAAPRCLEDVAGVLPALVERALVPVLRAPAALSRADEILVYLQTGSLPWHVAAHELIALIRSDGALQEEVARIAPSSPQATFRALQLLPDEKWSLLAPALLRGDVARIAADGSIVRDTRLRRATALITGSGVNAPSSVAAASVDPPRDVEAPGTEAPRFVEASAVQRAHGSPFEALSSAAERAHESPSVAAAFEPAKGPSHSAAPRHPSAAEEAASAPLRFASPLPIPRSDNDIRLRPVRAPGAPPEQIVDATTVADAVAVTPAAQRREQHEHEPKSAREPSADSEPHARPESALPTAAAWHRREPFGRPAPLAGLVLVAPFLPRFLEQSRAKRSGVRTIDDLPRSAALLHAIAAGDAEPIEHELTFIKVLLGVDSLQIGGGLLTGGDLEEVDSLLCAVIDHWSALKKTSPRGLQTTFLRRPGLIREDEHGFRLQVAPSPFDVLLKQLPWTIGVVKLPWMTRAIVTEWPT
jgi:hypothetical protein